MSTSAEDVADLTLALLILGYKPRPIPPGCWDD